jgi:hypothetical protein
MNHTKITYPDLTEYFEGSNESYKDYFPISTHIRKEIRSHQIEGGLAGVLNSSITARINGLTDKQEIKTDQPTEITVNVVKNKKK